MGNMSSQKIKMGTNQLTEKIIGAAIEVHRVLGPGLLESAYEECLCHELDITAVPYERQVPLPVNYKGRWLDCGYRLDILVDDAVVVEIKALEQLLPIHEAQLLTYLKLGEWQVGLLINFNTTMLKHGIKRILNKYQGEDISTYTASSRSEDKIRNPQTPP